MYSSKVSIFGPYVHHHNDLFIGVLSIYIAYPQHIEGSR